MLFRACLVVTVPHNQSLLHWGREILLCPACAWLSLISATSIPPFLARSSLFWHATSNSSFLFLIISRKGLCVSTLHLNASSLLLRSACRRFLHGLALTVLLLVSVHAPALHAELNSKF